jgi:hypothetical protein
MCVCVCVCVFINKNLNTIVKWLQIWWELNREKLRSYAIDTDDYKYRVNIREMRGKLAKFKKKII